MFEFVNAKLEKTKATIIPVAVIVPPDLSIDETIASESFTPRYSISSRILVMLRVSYNTACKNKTKNKKMSVWRFSEVFGLNYKQIQPSVRRFKIAHKDSDMLERIDLVSLKKNILMMYKVVNSIKLKDVWQEGKNVEKVVIDLDGDN